MVTSNCGCVCFLVATLICSCAVVGQDKPASPDAPGDAMVNLSLPEELELKVFVELVSRQLNLNVLFDEQINGKRITIKTAGKVPKSSLLGLLESALRMKGLALVDAKQEGWKRIALATTLTPFADPTDGKNLQEKGATAAVTQIFTLSHAGTKRVAEVVKPFMSQPGGNVVELEEHGMLIVTEYASDMGRISDLIKLADRPLRDVSMRFVPVRHIEAAALAQQISQTMQAKAKARGTAASATAGGTDGLSITQDARTNQLLIIGTDAIVDEALEIAASLDVKLDVETKVYQLTNASPERVDRIAKELIGQSPSAKRYRSSIDREAGLLIITAPPEVHATVTKLAMDLDVPVPDSQNRVRFYKLANAKAADVLETITLIEGGAGIGQISRPNEAGETAMPGSGTGGAGPGPNRPPPGPGSELPLPPSYQGERSREPGATDIGEPGQDRLRPLRRSVQQGQSTVTADINTNSLIVVAEPAVQKVYEDLIRQLDRRRPQVLIEATIVSIDTTNGFSLGIELASNADVGDNSQLVTFSSFGLSSIDDLGVLSPIPGVGFNGALIRSDIANVVVRALASHGHARVMSAPRILVNDNATGTLSSVAEEPFTSVNASDTVATTSFAGFVSAGTDITVTPHIAEGDHLIVDFTVAQNSFSGSGAAGVPPPRQTNSVNSQVTIPDGHTIIVGGLNRNDRSKTRQSIPILGDLPLIGDAFGNRSENESSSTLFIFLRPVILRDDKFEDLKYLSSLDMKRAELNDTHPASSPMLMR